jgi:hypothetical protein
MRRAKGRTPPKPDSPTLRNPQKSSRGDTLAGEGFRSVAPAASVIRSPSKPIRFRPGNPLMPRTTRLSRRSLAVAARDQPCPVRQRTRESRGMARRSARAAIGDNGSPRGFPSRAAGAILWHHWKRAADFPPAADVRADEARNPVGKWIEFWGGP